MFNETRRVSLPMAAALAAIATLLSCSRAAIHAQTMALPPQGLQSGQQPDLNGVRAQPSMLLQQAGHDDVMRTDLGVENVDGSQNQRSPIFPSPSYLPSPVADARAQSIDPGLAGFPEKNQVRGSWDIIDATRVSARGNCIRQHTHEPCGSRIFLSLCNTRPGRSVLRFRKPNHGPGKRKLHWVKRGFVDRCRFRRVCGRGCRGFKR